MLLLVTCRSFSAVGLFFGFLVRASLTKWWKLFVLFGRKKNNKRNRKTEREKERESSVNKCCLNNRSLSKIYFNMCRKWILETCFTTWVYLSTSEAGNYSWSLRRAPCGKIQRRIYHQIRLRSNWIQKRKEKKSPSHLMGCRSNMGGCSSANSIAVMPTAQISHSWL